MLKTIFSSIIEISIVSSIIITLLAILYTFINKRYAAKWHCVIWFVIMLRLLVPINITLPSAPIVVPEPPKQEVVVNRPVQQTQPVVTEQVKGETTTTPTTPQQNISQKETIQTQPVTVVIDRILIAAYVWLFGMFAVSVFYCIKRIRFHQYLKWNSQKVDQKRLLNMITQVSDEIRLSKNVTPILCKGISSPMVISLVKPKLLLPMLNYSDENLKAILRHELIHIKKNHLWFKFGILLCEIVYWFNPFVYLMTRFAQRDIEYACDSAVLKYTSESYKEEYSRAILSVIENTLWGNKRTNLVLSTGFSDGKKTLKNRFQNIFDDNKKKKGFFIIVALILAITIVGSFVVFGKKDVKQVNDKLSITIREQTLDDIDRVIDQFKREYPKVEVTINKIPMQYNPNLIKKIQTEIMAGKGTDIVVLPLDNDMNLEKVALSGAFCDINTMLKQDISFNRELYFEPVLDAGVYKGKQIFMPLSFNVPMLLTTQECLNKYEIDTNKLNTLSDMYATFAKTINVHDIDRLFTDSYDMNRFLSYAITTISKTQINNLADDNSLKKICDEYKQVYPISNTKMSLDVVNMCPYDAMKEDKTVFVNTSSLADFYYRYYLIAEHGVTPIFKPIPSPKGGVQAYLGDSVAISSNSPNKQNAYHFLKIALSEKLQHVNPYGGFEMPYFPVLRSGVQSRINLFKQQITGENRLSEEERLNKFTELEQRQLDNILNSINYCISNANNYSFAYSELEPYFKNEKTYEQCIKKLQSKLDIYLSE